MNAAEWRRVHEIFAASLDLASEERSVFLGRECGANREERREVERLLAEHEIERSTGSASVRRRAATGPGGISWQV